APLAEAGTATGSSKAAGASQNAEDLRKGRLLSALLAASRDLDDSSRDLRFELIAAEIEPQEIAAAFDLASHFSYRARHGLIGALIARWVEFDPQAAAEYVLATPGYPNVRRDMVMEAMRDWGQKDLAAAKAWAMALKNPVQQRQAMAGLIDGI